MNCFDRRGFRFPAVMLMEKLGYATFKVKAAVSKRNHINKSLLTPFQEKHGFST
jgi:hypothetical protein